MATGRKYIVRYSHRKRVNRFSPNSYNSAAQAITGVRFRQVVSILTPYPIPDRKVVIVTYAKGDSNLVSYIQDVLTQNGINTKKVNQKNKRAEFEFADRNVGQKALNIIDKMKGDTLLLSKIDYSGTIPVGTSENGIKVPLSGYTQEQQSNNDGGHDSFKKNGASKDTDTDTEANNYSRWFLIGGAVLVGVIVLLAVLKKNKKI